MLKLYLTAIIRDHIYAASYIFTKSVCFFSDTDIGLYYIYILGSMTGGSGSFSNLLDLPLRFLVASWFVFVMLLANTYTSNIIADITMHSFTPKINSVQQLVALGYSWGTLQSQKTISKHLDVIFDLQVLLKVHRIMLMHAFSTITTRCASGDTHCSCQSAVVCQRCHTYTVKGLSYLVC